METILVCCGDFAVKGRLLGFAETDVRRILTAVLLKARRFVMVRGFRN
jgi:hypothetical protein